MVRAKRKIRLSFLWIITYIVLEDWALSTEIGL